MERMEISKAEKCTGIAILVAVFSPLRGDRKMNFTKVRDNIIFSCVPDDKAGIVYFLVFFFLVLGF